jgi:hypothetical protein
MPHVEMPNARGLVSKSLNSGCTDEQEARLHAPADDVDAAIFYIKNDELT